MSQPGEIINNKTGNFACTIYFFIYLFSDSWIRGYVPKNESSNLLHFRTR